MLLTLARCPTTLAEAAGQNVWMEQDKSLSTPGKTAPSLHAGDCGLAVSYLQKARIRCLSEKKRFVLPLMPLIRSGGIVSRSAHV